MIIRVYGLAVPFWRTTSRPVDGGSLREVFLPGAFDPLRRVCGATELRIDHERTGPPLAAVKTGGLRLESSGVGLWFEARIGGRSARLLWAQWERGGLTGASVSFIPRLQSDARSNGVPVVLVEGVELLREISLCVGLTPAYPHAHVAVEMLQGQHRKGKRR
jgi:HK97 family phage prohead protease